MSEIYPCRVVITNNSELIRFYNEDPENALMTSRCFTAEEVFCLLEEDKKIETIILVNGEGENFICRITEKFKWNKKNMPDIVRIEVSDNPENATIEIRKSIYKSSLLFLWGGLSFYAVGHEFVYESGCHAGGDGGCG